MSKQGIDTKVNGGGGPPPGAFQRTAHHDGSEHHMSHHHSTLKPCPPPYPRAYSYPPPHYASRPPHPIQSVVTTSFSMDEEREDGSSRHSGPPPGAAHARAEYRAPFEGRHVDVRAPRHGRSPSHGRDEKQHRAFEPPPPPQQQHHHGREAPPARYGRDLAPPPRDGDMDMRPPPPDMGRSRPPTRVPPSPRGGPPNDNPPHLHRSHSSGGSIPPPYRSPAPLKRSFWHHSRPGDEYQASLPHEFMPPKRSKVGSTARRDYVVTARSHSDEMYPPEAHGGTPSPRSPPSAGWFNRAMSWEAREEYYRRDPNAKSYQDVWARSPSYREASPGQHWSDAPPIPSPRTRYSAPEAGHFDQAWGQPPRWRHPEEHSWGAQQNRDEAESKHMGGEIQEREGFDVDMRRQNTFESASECEPPMRFIAGPPSHGMDFNVHSPPRGMVPKTAGSMGPSVDGDRKGGPIRLLAQPEDRISLSETLCIVRENIEVFTATIEDVEAPAPGRKHAVVVGQVGLRCIHCRHTTRSSERVKRAVCYPSSIKRIYRTVIDMKLDHFLHCKYVPDSLKNTLNALKANNTRSTGTTMQYFIRAASAIGMVDGPSGVRLVENSPNSAMAVSSSGEGTKSVGNSSPASAGGKRKLGPTESERADPVASPEFRIHRNNSLSSESTNNSSLMEDSNNPKEFFGGKIALTLPEDKMSLSPLRCFLREQVCAFSATEEDIAVRTPTTFSVSVGQVGIGCMHCLNQPAKLRLNRAVCFPFSIARIYQSVADIQRFHLGECKMVPPDLKKQFVELQSASSKGSKGLATRQYWVTSAKKIGLVDTPKGIRFGRDPSVPETKSVSLDILAQVASNVTTVNRPLVLPEDKPYIAEFLYAVMEQLQPCRFTEADRNKRRLKDVGCIGVECKHCAGQVDSRKFFWSSVNAVESNFVSVHTHMMECRMIPDPLKDKLAELKKLRKEQTAALKTGSQKAFFSRVWKRLHSEAPKGKKQKQEQQQQQDQEQDQVQDKSAGTTGSDEDEAKQDGDDDVDAATATNDGSVVAESPSVTDSPKATKETKDMEVSTPESPSSESLHIVNKKLAVVSV